MRLPDEDERRITIKNLIAPLISAFRVADVERVTTQLVLRENGLLEAARFERLSTERDLKDEILKVTQERDELEVKYKERVWRLEVENAEIIKAMEGPLRNLEKDMDLLVKGGSGEVSVDYGGSRVDVGKSGEAVLKVEIDADRCNGFSTLDADGGDSGKGNGGLLGQDRKEPSSRSVVWICDSDDDCTASPRQRAGGTGNASASSAQLSSSLAATETSGLKITSNGQKKRKTDLPTDGHKLTKLDRKPTTSFSNGESRTTYAGLQAQPSLHLTRVSCSSSSSHDFSAVPIVFVSSTETKANEVSKKWPFQADLVAALREDSSLCLIAICALYRQAELRILSVLSSQKSVDRADLSRIKALGAFITDGDKQCKPRKSVEELSNHDPKGLDDCKRLSSKYSLELFRMYQLHGDSLFS